MFKKRDQVFFAQGSLGLNIVWITMITWLTFFYVTPDDKGVALLPIALIGIILFVGRIIDAFTDVLVGFWSDNATYKRGRRVPFILFGAPLFGLSFFLIWTPPIVAGETIIAIYLFIIISLHFFFMTIVFVPFNSLLPELAVTSNERLSVSAWMAVFGTIGVAIAGASGLLIAKVGYPIMGVILGLIVIAAFYVALLGIKEKPRQADSAVKLNIKDAFIKTLNNRQFLFSMIPIICLHFGFGLMLMSFPFFVTVVLGLTEAHVMLYQGGPIVIMIAFLPFWRWVGNRYGKKKGFRLCLILIAVCAPFYFIVGVLPGADILRHILSLIFFALLMVPFSGLFVFHNALIADVTDYDELMTGKRREGMYFSIWNFMMKLLAGIIFLVFGFLGHHLGIVQGDFLGIQMVGPVMGLAALLGFLVFKKYRLPDTIRGKTLEELGFTK